MRRPRRVMATTVKADLPHGSRGRSAESLPSGCPVSVGRSSGGSMLLRAVVASGSKTPRCLRCRRRKPSAPVAAAKSGLESLESCAARSSMGKPLSGSRLDTKDKQNCYGFEDSQLRTTIFKYVLATIAVMLPLLLLSSDRMYTTSTKSLQSLPLLQLCQDTL